MKRFPASCLSVVGIILLLIAFAAGQPQQQATTDQAGGGSSLIIVHVVLLNQTEGSFDAREQATFVAALSQIADVPPSGVNIVGLEALVLMSQSGPYRRLQQGDVVARLRVETEISAESGLDVYDTLKSAASSGQLLSKLQQAGLLMQPDGVLVARVGDNAPAGKSPALSKQQVAGLAGGIAAGCLLLMVAAIGVFLMYHRNHTLPTGPATLTKGSKSSAQLLGQLDQQANKAPRWWIHWNQHANSFTGSIAAVNSTTSKGSVAGKAAAALVDDRGRAAVRVTASSSFLQRAYSPSRLPPPSAFERQSNVPFPTSDVNPPAADQAFVSPARTASSRVSHGAFTGALTPTGSNHVLDVDAQSNPLGVHSGAGRQGSLARPDGFPHQNSVGRQSSAAHHISLVPQTSLARQGSSAAQHSSLVPQASLVTQGSSTLQTGHFAVAGSVPRQPSLARQGSKAGPQLPQQGSINGLEGSHRYSDFHVSGLPMTMSDGRGTTLAAMLASMDDDTHHTPPGRPMQQPPADASANAEAVAPQRPSSAPWGWNWAKSSATATNAPAATAKPTRPWLVRAFTLSHPPGPDAELPQPVAQDKQPDWALLDIEASPQRLQTSASAPMSIPRTVAGTPALAADLRQLRISSTMSTVPPTPAAQLRQLRQSSSMAAAPGSPSAQLRFLRSMSTGLSLPGEGPAAGAEGQATERPYSRY